MAESDFAMSMEEAGALILLDDLEELPDGSHRQRSTSSPPSDSDESVRHFADLISGTTPIPGQEEETSDKEGEEEEKNDGFQSDPASEPPPQTPPREATPAPSSLLGFGLVRRLFSPWHSKKPSEAPLGVPEEETLDGPVDSAIPDPPAASSANEDFVLEAPPPSDQSTSNGLMRNVAHRITGRLRQLPVPTQLTENRIFENLRSSYDSTLRYINDKVKEKVEDRLEGLLENQVRPWLTRTALNPNMPRPLYEVGEKALDSIWPDIKEEIWALYEQNVLGTSLPIPPAAPDFDPETQTPFQKARAFILYHTYPYDRSFWAQLRDPWWWVFKIPALCPIYNISSLWFALIFLLLDRSDFFQMFNFILQFKGTQFFSLGVFSLLMGWFKYIFCVNFQMFTIDPDPLLGDSPMFLHTCDVHGAGVAKTVYSNAFGFGLRLALAWAAFNLLGSARKKRNTVLSWEGGPNATSRMTPYRRHLLDKARRRRERRERVQEEQAERNRFQEALDRSRTGLAGAGGDARPTQLQPRKIDMNLAEAAEDPSIAEGISPAVEDEPVVEARPVGETGLRQRFQSAVSRAGRRLSRSQPANSAPPSRELESEEMGAQKNSETVRTDGPESEEEDLGQLGQRPAGLDESSFHTPPQPSRTRRRPHPEDLYEPSSMDLDDFQPSQTTLQSIMEEELSYGRGLGRARLHWMLRVDLFIFISLCSFGLLSFLVRYVRVGLLCPEGFGGVDFLSLSCSSTGVSWAWQLSADFEVVKIMYGLASFHFALLMIPVVRMILIHSHDSGYNVHGQCVAKHIQEDYPPSWRQRPTPDGGEENLDVAGDQAGAEAQEEVPAAQSDGPNISPSEDGEEAKSSDPGHQKKALSESELSLGETAVKEEEPPAATLHNHGRSLSAALADYFSDPAAESVASPQNSPSAPESWEEEDEDEDEAEDSVSDADSQNLSEVD